MTQTEVAALRLALGVLRQAILDWPRSDYAISSIDDAHVRSRAPAAAAAWQASFDLARRTNKVDEYRRVRARLALYLRAVLRAERGDVGRWWVGERRFREFTRGGDFTGGTYAEWSRSARASPGARLARPLWLSAPPHGGKP